MTELEKAASGLLYDANSDPALLEARAQTSDPVSYTHLHRSFAYLRGNFLNVRAVGQHAGGSQRSLVQTVVQMCIRDRNKAPSVTNFPYRATDKPH